MSHVRSSHGGSLASAATCAVLLLLALGGCVRTSYVQTGPTLSALEDDARVRVFLTRRPACRAVEVGVVDVWGGELAARVEGATEVAREHGANAVVLVGGRTEVYTDTSDETIETETEGPDGGTTTTRTSVPTTTVHSYRVDRYAIVQLPSPCGRVDRSSSRARAVARADR